MDRVGLGLAGRSDQGRDREITLGRCRRPDPHRPVRRAHVQSIGVRVGIHRYALEPRLAAGSGDPDRDLAAVGDEDATDGHSLELIPLFLRVARNHCR